LINDQFLASCTRGRRDTRGVRGR